MRCSQRCEHPGFTGEEEGGVAGGKRAARRGAGAGGSSMCPLPPAAKFASDPDASRTTDRNVPYQHVYPRSHQKKVRNRNMPVLPPIKGSRIPSNDTPAPRSGLGR
eukprot:1176567-Prorocentrum_minimum.AAC.3